MLTIRIFDQLWQQCHQFRVNLIASGCYIYRVRTIHDLEKPIFSLGPRGKSRKKKAVSFYFPEAYGLNFSESF